MIIKPKIRRHICTTVHPVGCKKTIQEQINYAKQYSFIQHAPKRVLIIGSSNGYGLSSRIVAAFCGHSATIGIFHTKKYTSGFYNALFFENQAKLDGLYSKTINADAFCVETIQKSIDIIQRDLGQIDLIIYSLSSSTRKISEGYTARSYLKPIGKACILKTIDINYDNVIYTKVFPATYKEIQETIMVMGGQNWECWINMLFNAKLLSRGCKTIAYSYIGPRITWPIYWEGTMGCAKRDLERTACVLNRRLSVINGSANIVVLKSIITQSSAVIPMMPLYISLVSKKMRQENLYEDCIMYTMRMFTEHLYKKNSVVNTDYKNRIRMDSVELRSEIQQYCDQTWAHITTNNLNSLTDYVEYKKCFLQLFGF